MFSTDGEGAKKRRGDLFFSASKRGGLIRDRGLEREGGLNIEIMASGNVAQCITLMFYGLI